MSFLVPIGIFVCSVLWLKGPKSLWARAVVLTGFLLLLAVLVPSLGADKSRANLTIYQMEVIDFSSKVAYQLERGEHEAARKRLLYFAKNQDSETVNDLEAMRIFFKREELADGKTAKAGSQGSVPQALE